MKEKISSDDDLAELDPAQERDTPAFKLTVTLPSVQPTDGTEYHHPIE